LEAVVVLAHGKEGVGSTSDALDVAANGLAILEHNFVLLLWTKPSVWILKLSLGSLMEALLFHTERELFLLASMDDLVSAHPLVEHLRVSVGLQLLWLLDGALFEIVVHKFVALVKHGLGHCDYLLAFIAS
jgi:hypothetical protein